MSETDTGAADAGPFLVTVYSETVKSA